ncbi:MAG: hypothetical protein IKB22_01485 [Lentisphaeria bacterium]|nr:hypothetical protein [Lentisphaeria bacterium]
MKEILTIAESTCKGILKMKVVYFLVIRVWILIGSMYRYNELSLDRHRDLMLDMALFMNQIAGILTVLSLTFDIPRELREGIASTFLTKSLGRTKYLLGKTLGVYGVAFVVCTLIAAGSYFIYQFCFTEDILRNFIKIELLIMLGVIPMAAVCVFCAIVLPEMAAPIIALLAIWFSSLTGRLKIPVLNGGILPDMEIFNLKEHIIYQVAIPWSYLFGAAVWGIAFALFLLMLSGIIFRFKDIK